MAEPVATTRDVRLHGRVAIITGAARGLGKVMAEGLARAGARVVFADVDGAALAAAIAAIEGQPGCEGVAGIRCDITVKADCERLVVQTVEKFGALHILVNNAGRGPRLTRRSGNRSSSPMSTARS